MQPTVGFAAPWPVAYSDVGDMVVCVEVIRLLINTHDSFVCH